MREGELTRGWLHGTWRSEGGGPLTERRWANLSEGARRAASEGMADWREARRLLGPLRVWCTGVEG